MQFIVEYRGVALGTIDLERTGLTGGTLRVQAGYPRVESVVRDATLATANYGFLGPVDDPISAQCADERIRVHRALLDALELRSPADGSLVRCEFLDLTQGADDGAPPILFVSMDEAIGEIVATVAPNVPPDAASASRADV
jgi:hypothetical protein